MKYSWCPPNLKIELHLSKKSFIYIYFFFSNRIYQGQKVTAPLGEKNPILKKYIEINTESRSKGLRPTAEANVNGWMVAWLYSVELGGNYLSLNDSFFVPFAFFSRLMLIFSYSLSNQISILMSNTLHLKNFENRLVFD